MSIDFSDMSMMQLSDSFFPTGLYTMSSGLETLFDEKKIHTIDDIQAFIETVITQQIGPSDCVALSKAYDFASSGDIDGVIECDKFLHSMKLTKEARDASCMAGSQMIKCVKAFSQDDTLQKFSKSLQDSKTLATHPVASAVCSNALGITKKNALQMLLYGVCVSIIGASLRLGILDHIQSQKALHNLKPIISKTVDIYADKNLDEMWQFTPEYDILQMTHEQKFSKMFIT